MLRSDFEASAVCSSWQLNTFYPDWSTGIMISYLPSAVEELPRVMIPGITCEKENQVSKIIKHIKYIKSAKD